MDSTGGSEVHEIPPAHSHKLVTYMHGWWQARLETTLVIGYPTAL